MKNPLLTLSLSASMILFMVTACAEDSDSTALERTPKTQTPSVNARVSAPVADTKTADTKVLNDAIMDEPVDFSSPEKVQETLQNIQGQAGEKAATKLKNALGFLLVYDLSVSHNKSKLYKKLDGQTANEIIAQMNR